MIILFWGWRRFRYGGVVEEGTGIHGEAGLEATMRQAGRLKSPTDVLTAMAAGEFPGGNE
jgi:hypothetical protein